ncbi:uncharacterized protein H6S33_011051 [Morchella sextelata]|uniref:uncharacterized protein n=1 Tax=Morchella sextelata TaxID=1174677 RepID=UPI001D055559|nr:uncharacterized protein H6S33_011051 [Morchella sextelata]KAH0611786.1 hypothetical protein H6S33_011051 [Morchella sextelata]
MSSASNNLSSPKAPGAAFSSHPFSRSTNSSIRSWADILAGPPPPNTPEVPRTPKFQTVCDHELSEIPTLTLSEPLLPLDRSITSLGFADWRNVNYDGFSDPPSVFTCWNMGVPGLDVYGYPLDGYPWRATYERAPTPQPLVDEQPTPSRIVYTARAVAYDTITKLPSPVTTTRTSKMISLLEDIDAMTISRIPMVQKKSEYVSKPHPRGPRVKETSQQRSERRRRNGGRKRNATWLARHELYKAKKKLEEG